MSASKSFKLSNRLFPRTQQLFKGKIIKEKPTWFDSVEQYPPIAVKDTQKVKKIEYAEDKLLKMFYSRSVWGKTQAKNLADEKNSAAMKFVRKQVYLMETRGLEANEAFVMVEQEMLEKERKKIAKMNNTTIVDSDDIRAVFTPWELRDSAIGKSGPELWSHYAARKQKLDAISQITIDKQKAKVGKTNLKETDFISEEQQQDIDIAATEVWKQFLNFHSTITKIEIEKDRKIPEVSHVTRRNPAPYGAPNEVRSNTKSPQRLQRTSKSKQK